MGHSEQRSADNWSKIRSEKLEQFGEKRDGTPVREVERLGTSNRQRMSSQQLKKEKDFHSPIVDTSNQYQNKKSAQMLQYYSNSFQQALNSGLSNKLDQQTLNVTKMTISDPIQRRYEESKAQFEQCLKDTILRQER